MTFVCSCNIFTLASHCKCNHALIISFDDNGHVIRGLMRFELIKTITHMVMEPKLLKDMTINLKMFKFILVLNLGIGKATLLRGYNAQASTCNQTLKRSITPSKASHNNKTLVFCPISCLV